MEPEQDDFDRNAEFLPYALLAMLFLLIIDLAREVLPVAEWVLICSIIVLALIVVAGFVRDRAYLYLFRRITERSGHCSMNLVAAVGDLDRCPGVEGDQR